MRKRRHVRRRKALDQRQARLSGQTGNPVAPAATDAVDYHDPDDFPVWERDSVTEDGLAITVARENDQPLPTPRHPLSWIFTEERAEHETLIPHEQSLIWRACQAAFANAEENWKSRCETLAKRKNSGRGPELSDRRDDDD